MRGDDGGAREHGAHGLGVGGGGVGELEDDVGAVRVADQTEEVDGESERADGVLHGGACLPKR